MSTVTDPRRLVIWLAALVAFGPLSIDMYLPSLPQIAEELAAPQSRIQQTITFFLAGFSVGMLLYGPLSDRFGRRRLLIGGISLYLLASIGCALADTADSLLLWRTVQALGGAAASVLARAIVRDLFALNEAAKILSQMHLITMVATLLAPLVGGYLILLSGWRTLFGVLFVLAGVCLLAVLLKVPETLPPERRGKSVAGAFKAFGFILGQRRALGYILCMGMAFAGMFTYITASPFIYIDYFGVSPQAYAWLFALNIGGIMVVTFLNARLVTRLGPQTLLWGGASLALIAGLALAVLGSSGLGGVYAVVVCLLLFISVTGLMSANAIASLLSLYPHYAGAAAGLAVAVQFGLGTALSALTSLLHDGSPTPMSLVIGACGLLCILALCMTRPGATASRE